MDGCDGSTDVRVRFAETDARGSSQLEMIWFELARIDYLKRHAGGYQRLRDEGIESLVLESHVRYLTPARFDDRLVVHACIDVRGARFRFEYAITRDGTTIADGWTPHGTVDGATLRPTRLRRGSSRPSLLRRRRCRRRRRVVASARPRHLAGVRVRSGRRVLAALPGFAGFLAAFGRRG